MNKITPLICLAVLGMTLLSRAQEVNSELKDALLELGKEKVPEDSIEVPEKCLKKIIFLKREIGKLLEETANTEGLLKNEIIDQAIKSMLIKSAPQYKENGASAIERSIGNNGGFFDSITWAVTRLGKDNEFVFVIVQGDIACGVDSFVYGFRNDGKKWVRIFENDDPYYTTVNGGKYFYKILTFYGGNKRYFLIANSYSSCTLNGGKIGFCLYEVNPANSELTCVLGPASEYAIVPDPENPFSVSNKKNGAVIDFISDRGVDETFKTEIYFEASKGTIRQTFKVK